MVLSNETPILKILNFKISIETILRFFSTVSPKISGVDSADFLMRHILSNLFDRLVINNESWLEKSL